MPFKQIANGLANKPLASDVNQLIKALIAQADIGPMSLCAPSSAPIAPSLSIGSAGVLNGAYKYQLVYATGWKEDNGNIWISGFVPGPEASISPANQQVTGTSPVIAVPIVATLVYRTAANGASGTEKFALALTSGLPWTDNVADAALGTGMPSWNGTAIPASVPNANSSGTRLAQLSLYEDFIQGTTQYPTFTGNQITQILHKDSGGNVLRTDLFKYLTLASLINNGSFENGTTGWTNSGGTIDASVYKFGTQSLKFTANGQTAVQTITIPNGHICYAATSYNANLGSAAGQLCAFDGDGVSNPVATSLGPTTSGWAYSSLRKTAASGGISIRLAQYTTGIINFDGVIILDLTSIYGAGNEPTQAQMDAIMNLYGGFIDTTPVQRIEETRTLITGEALSCAYNFDPYWNLVAEVIV
ncbi:hypothetical protein [Desulfosporosinus sp. SB140]|uniref:hypothetical protein n=1 Tax=Desulfosporosinus paludis TaxID=3115649 RepID=UPI00389026A9